MEDRRVAGDRSCQRTPISTDMLLPFPVPVITSRIPVCLGVLLCRREVLVPSWGVLLRRACNPIKAA